MPAWVPFHLFQTLEHVVPATVKDHHRDGQTLFDPGNRLPVKKESVRVQNIRRKEEQVAALLSLQ
jgi:hypothetical protein